MYMTILIVEDIGLEPMTPCLQSKCSSQAELIPHRQKHILESAKTMPYRSNFPNDCLSIFEQSQYNIIDFYRLPQVFKVIIFIKTLNNPIIMLILYNDCSVFDLCQGV